MPKVEKQVGDDPDPSEWLFVTLEQKRIDQSKPYDAKKACWVPDESQGYVLGEIKSTKGELVTVALPGGEVMSSWIKRSCRRQSVRIINYIFEKGCRSFCRVSNGKRFLEFLSVHCRKLIIIYTKVTKNHRNREKAFANFYQSQNRSKHISYARNKFLQKKISRISRQFPGSQFFLDVGVNFLEISTFVSYLKSSSLIHNH